MIEMKKKKMLINDWEQKVEIEMDAIEEEKIMEEKIIDNGGKMSLEEFAKCLNTLRENVNPDTVDLYNFAHYLSYMGHAIHEKEEETDQHPLVWGMKTYYCNRALFTRYEYNAYPIVEQMVSCSLWRDIKVKWRSPDYDCSCFGCNVQANQISLCPYRIAALIKKMVESYNEIIGEEYLSELSIYRDILGKNLVEFSRTYSSDIAYDRADFEDIDSKSAMAAFQILKSRTIRPMEMDSNRIVYKYVPLCQVDHTDPVITDIISFWKNRSYGTTRVINDVKNCLKKDHGSSCGRCRFKFCPDKLAAYFIFMAAKYQCDPGDLAYSVVVHNTRKRLSIAEDVKLENAIANLKELPLAEECHDYSIETLSYILSKKKNMNVPIININAFIETEDVEISKKYWNIMYNFVWYYDYLGVDVPCEMKQIDFSDTDILELTKIYKEQTAPCFYFISGLNKINLNDEEEAKKARTTLFRWISWLRKNPNKSITYISGRKNEIRALLAFMPELKEIFKKTIFVNDYGVNAICNYILDKIKTTFTMEEDIFEALKRYIEADYPGAEFKNLEYVNNLYENIVFNHYKQDFNASKILEMDDIPKLPYLRNKEDIYKELYSMIGLTEIKKKLQQLEHKVAFDMKRGNAAAMSMHMVFTGNPGTGKTTVASLIAEILYNIGYIKQNKLVVCSAKDLIGEYYGQTAIKTAAKCEEAYDGVLFIDEAYQLNPKASGGIFGKYEGEAMAELLTQMENNRGRLIVIFAGYTDEMRALLREANVGLRSRIGDNIIQFPDYTINELIQIFQGLLEKNSFTIDDMALLKVTEIINKHIQDEHFGNARLIRNMYESIYRAHADRVYELDETDEEFDHFNLQDCVSGLKNY